MQNKTEKTDWLAIYLSGGFKTAKMQPGYWKRWSFYKALVTTTLRYPLVPFVVLFELVIMWPLRIIATGIEWLGTNLYKKVF